MDSPAANAAFAKQIGVTFPLLSDMRGLVLQKYGILGPGPKAGSYQYEWAQRTTFVIDKQGIIRHIEFGGTAINPATAVAMCINMSHGK